MAADNDRITQAVLKQVVENNTKVLERIDKRLEKIDSCIVSLEHRMSVVETRQEGMREDITGIRTKADGWNLINSIGASAAGLLAWFK